MDAKQGYLLINGLAFIPLCFFGINPLLLSIIAIVSDWAKGTIVSSVSNAYSKFLPNNTDSDGNISILITSFSYRDLSNFSGGSFFQYIFVTAIFMYVIDRKFVRAITWSLIAPTFSLFGLIDAPTVGLLIHENDDGWKFTVAYNMMAVFSRCLEFGQRHKWIKEANQCPDEEQSNNNTNESDL